MNTLNAETRARAGDLQIFSLTLSQLSYRSNDSILVKHSHNTRDAEHLAWKPEVSTWQADAYIVAMRPEKTNTYFNTSAQPTDYVTGSRQKCLHGKCRVYMS